MSVDGAAVSGGSAPEAGTGLTAAAALSWIGRWDRQQQGFMPEREERFTALIDAVAEAAGRPDPLVLDLGCGPGSLAVRLLDQIPAATVIAIDADPVLLALGRAAWPDRAGLRFADRDLREPGWSHGLSGAGLDRPVDAAVSTTALHWLPAARLGPMYAEVAGLLRPGGVLLNGDHLYEDETAAPTVARLCDALGRREGERCPPAPGQEGWAEWWAAALADPALAGPVAERARRAYSAEHHGSETRWLHVHLAALRDAGFAEAGPLWQHGSSRILCGVAGG